MRVNKALRKNFRNNCPLIEVDGDGREVGSCWFYMSDEKICPRHGDITSYLEKQTERDLTNKVV